MNEQVKWKWEGDWWTVGPSECPAEENECSEFTKARAFWLEYVALCERHRIIVCNDSQPAVELRSIEVLPERRQRPDMRSHRNMMTRSDWQDGWQVGLEGVE